MKKNIDKENVGEVNTYIKGKLKGNYSSELKNRLRVTNEGVITLIEKGLADLEEVEGVIIPRGFEHVEGTTVSTGLVIKNTTDNNEFVWVPVKTGTFVREGFGTDISAYGELYEKEGYTS